MDPLMTTMMMMVSVIGGILIGVGLCQWMACRKEEEARSLINWTDDFLTDVRARVGDYMLKNDLTKDQAESFRNLIGTMKTPGDIRLLKKWYEYTSGLMLTLAKSEGLSEPFKLYLHYVVEVIGVLVVNKLEAAPPKRQPPYKTPWSRRANHSWPISGGDDVPVHPLDPRSLK